MEESKPYKRKSKRLFPSFTLLSKTYDCKTLPGYRTDHSAISLKLNLNDIPRGKGYWKFNNNLLQDKEYVGKVKLCINQILEETVNAADHQYIWELIKMRIRSITIEYSIKKSKQKVDKTKNIEREIFNIEQRVQNSPTDLNLDLLKNKKAELELERKKQMDSIVFRAKAEWHEVGEKNAKFFSNLEKKKFVNKTIYELIDNQGNSITNQDKILLEQQSFFEKLYKKPDSVPNEIDTLYNEFIEGNVKLSNEDKMFCEGELTFEECGKALKNMANRKSPGSDGYTTEFYKFFWKDIGKIVVESLNMGYRKGELSNFQTQGIITCLPKESKDRRFLKHWRPISLLNIDYKIGASAIANRLKFVLPKIISDTQKGFLKHRFIGENTRLLFDIMEYLQQANKKGLLLLLDFEKAFDSVGWNFILKSLEAFNFGESLCKWFSVLYNKSKSCVINNGYLSNFFNLERSCRQGDPLAPYMFIISVELLSNRIKKDNIIQGIRVGNTNFVINQYADDTFLLLDGSERSLRRSMEIIKSFGIISGLKLNITQSNAIWIGSKTVKKEKNCEDLDINWLNGPFKLLGITFPQNLKNIVEINYKDKICSIKKLLGSNINRDITPLGRITIIKNLALPKLIHLFSSLPTPPKK